MAAARRALGFGECLLPTHAPEACAAVDEIHSEASSPEGRAAARIQALVRGKAHRVGAAAEDAESALEWAQFYQRSSSPVAAERLTQAAALLASSQPVARELERRHAAKLDRGTGADRPSSIGQPGASVGIAATEDGEPAEGREPSPPVPRTCSPPTAASCHLRENVALSEFDRNVFGSLASQS